MVIDLVCTREIQLTVGSGGFREPTSSGGDGIQVSSAPVIGEPYLPGPSIAKPLTFIESPMPGKANVLVRISPGLMVALLLTIV